MHGKNSTVKNITAVYEKNKKEDTYKETYADTITLDFYYCKFLKIPISEIAYWSIGASVAALVVTAIFLILVKDILKK